MISTITISELDEKTLVQLRTAAARFGLSLESYAADILRQSAKEPTPPASDAPPPTIDSLAGTWTDQEFQEFKQAVSPFEQIDDTLWK
jgi:plasmid stability protein